MDKPKHINPLPLFLQLSFPWRGVVCLALITGLMAVTLAHVFNDFMVTEVISHYVTVLFMGWLAVTDAKHFILPNRILLAWFGCRILLIFTGFLVYETFDVIIGAVMGAAIIGLLFLIIYYASKRSMGGGDVKLSFVLGLALTWNMVFTAVFYALILCAVFALVMLGLKKMSRKDALPLGPFLYGGVVLAYFLQI